MNIVLPKFISYNVYNYEYYYRAYAMLQYGLEREAGPPDGTLLRPLLSAPSLLGIAVRGICRPGGEQVSSGGAVHRLEPAIAADCGAAL